MDGPPPELPEQAGAARPAGPPGPDGTARPGAVAGAEPAPGAAPVAGAGPVSGAEPAPGSGPDGAVPEEDLMRALYREHAGALFTYVLKLVAGDRHLAEDVVQETLLRAWKSAAQLDPAARSLRPWLVTVARRIVIDGHRSRQARPPRPPPPPWTCCRRATNWSARCA